MLSALLDTLGKATRRIFGAEGSDEREHAPPQAEREEPPKPVRNLAFDQLEADLERDERALSTPQGRARRARERAETVDPSLIRPTSKAVQPSPDQPSPVTEGGSLGYEASFNLSDRAPSATALFEEARRASEAPPPTPKTPLSFMSGAKARQQDARTITPQRSLSLIMDEPNRVEERGPTRSAQPSPPSSGPAQAVQSRPSATRVKSSSRVLRPESPPESVNAEPSPPPRRRRERSDAGAKASPSTPQPKRSRANKAGDSYSIGDRPERAQRKVNPRLAHTAQAQVQGFEASGAFGLKNMSASQARLSPEERLAPALKERPEKVESSAYARYWGHYSATTPSVNFSSILDYDLKAGWRKAWTQQTSDAPGSGLLEGEGSQRGAQPNESMLDLLGGRTGYFGDLMDRQWASKLHPKRDAAEFAYQESSKFK